MGRRGPKVKFSRTRDAAALFMALRDVLGYRRAIADVSALLGVPERNIEREIDPKTTLLSPTFAESNALCAIAANIPLIRANLRSRAVDNFDDWPEPFKGAIRQLLPGTPAAHF